MNTALIVAAGAGSRAQLNQSKVLYLINHKPLFMYSVEAFLELGFKIVLVVSKNDLNEIQNYINPENVVIVIGGKTRSESVKFGLKVVQTPYVYIHDAARPLITKKAILEIEKSLQFHDAVLLAERLTSSLKRVEHNELSSLKRDAYVLAQTPQAFLTEKIRYAYIRNEDTYEDDISLYQAFYPEEKVFVVYNEDPNLKVTYPIDFQYVKMHLEKEEPMRIGHSFDIHQLVDNRPLILGGIQIPYEKGLLGHSDADVLLHAIAEAMLGALSLGDLGTYYPDTNPQFKDINSMRILKEIYEMIRQKGYIVGNIDSTVYAELPKLNPYITQIKQNISKNLNILEDQIAVKATTYEKMDAIGEKKAIAAEAVVLLKKV
ncbi:MAG TPA: 2-C-methyl-D-erythritol 2,4-cyclodiphosphate synthase [Acholeplasmataceae bacterium]|nr:2-C-methyl-D-erythritol 2,4-cyclodiphosphate synthase [Acholeplasmataceae bacterium]